MKIHRFIVVCVILIVSAILFITFSFRQDAQDNAVIQKEDATPIQIGVMTERQREHSRLYDGFGMRKSIIDLLKTSNPETPLIIVRGPEESGGSGLTQPLALSEFIEKITCSADMVATGQIVDKESQITSGRNFLFSDYTVLIESVLKSRLTAESIIGSKATITQPGGKVLLNGRVVIAIDKSSGKLIVGRKYLFFLKSVSNTGAFRPQKGTSELGQLTLNGLSEATSNEYLEGQDASTILALVRTASTQCHEHTKELE